MASRVSFSSLCLGVSQQVDRSHLAPFWVCRRSLHDRAPQFIGEGLHVRERYVPLGRVEGTIDYSLAAERQVPGELLEVTFPDKSLLTTR